MKTKKTAQCAVTNNALYSLSSFESTRGLRNLIKFYGITEKSQNNYEKNLTRMQDEELALSKL